MTHIKKWIPILVLTIILVPTVKAESYVSKDDVVIDSRYSNYFSEVFGEDKEYTYFPYDCTFGSSYSRTCYFGIDSKNNYYDIEYTSSGTNIKKGVDNNFSVTGNNVIVVQPESISVLKYGITFIFIFIVVYIMIGVVFL